MGLNPVNPSALSIRRRAEPVSSETPLESTQTNTRLVWLIAAGALVMMGLRLGAIGLWAPDEPRYVQVAEEMRSMEHGAKGLVLLHLNGEPYTQKPPLYFWTAALLGAPFGHVSEALGRLPSAIAGVSLVLLTFRFGANLLGGASGALAAGLLLTTFSFSREARSAGLDVTLALFETAALFACWRIDRGMGRRGANLLLLHASLAAALLTKGPVGLLIPLLVVLSFLTWERRLRDLAKFIPWWGALLTLGPVLAWLAVSTVLAPPGHFDAAVTENLIGRFFSGTSHARPFYYFLYQLPLLAAPWSIWIPFAIYVGFRGRDAADDEERRAIRFLLAWVIASVCFFSLSSGKRGVYLIPTLPGLAMLLAHMLRLWCARARSLPWPMHAVSGLLAALIAAGGIWVARSDPLDSPLVSLALGVVALATVVLAVLAQWVSTRSRISSDLRLAIPIAAAFVIECAVFGLAFPALDDEKSPRKIALAAAEHAGPSGIGLVGDRALVGGLAYYSGQRIQSLDDDAAIAEFLRQGGLTIVIQSRKLERFPALRDTVPRFRARRGRRELVVLTPK